MGETAPATSESIDPVQPVNTTIIKETIHNIKTIFNQDYGSIPPRVSSVLDDVTNLYNGEWAEYQSCQVEYHTLQHALDVALATARIISGYHIAHSDKKIPIDTFIAGITAALLHDAGYLKDKNDNNGSGGKFSFTHVERSKLLAERYLSGLHWDSAQIHYVVAIIQMSDFTVDPEIPEFETPYQDIVAKAVATADLIAQIADVNYIERLHFLYDEFAEAYSFEGEKKLQKRSIKVYESFDELQNETASFYKNFILPRLNIFDRVDKNLGVFFQNGRNPYSENIIANLSGQLKNRHTQWQKLGEILQELGFVSEKIILEALEQQQAQRPSVSSEPSLLHQYLEHHIIDCKNQRTSSRSLGNILMEMKAIAPQILRESLLTQLLPSKLLNRLSRKEVNMLLETSLLIQNVYNDPWMFNQILEIINELLETESCSLLLANPAETELIVVAQAGSMLGAPPGESNSVDKGLSGWVFRHKQAATITEEAVSDFFPDYSDKESSQIRSVLATPIHLNGEVIGVLETFNKSKKQFTEHDMDMITILAHIISNSLSIICQMYQS
jgi:putative methionine-R-sulfoxide reductase with GAF domain/HD superfamily phosphodiesterase